jgi:hypothetical protein
MEQIQKTSYDRIKNLKDQIGAEPKIGRFIYEAIMSGNFEVKSQEEIRNSLRDKARAGRGSENWMTSSRAFSSSSTDSGELSIHISHLMELPSDYVKEHDEWKARSEAIWSEIYSINSQTSTLLIRIQLASDKTLETMIQEVDDMGNISLMETKLKLNENPITQKHLKESNGN